ncbi:hypothetical protein VTN77DRAFT_496 [Rasamsonia byssochlamydoides]|uniref:uncharacterized protein n=1 Tax=Rasamsonia byssochlamydoides TaxID=89139 RepID=UPI0037428FB4
MRDPEILVHAAAPSGARDDARYHTQVQAFLAFEPVSRQPVFSSKNGSIHEPPVEEAALFEQSGGDERSVHSGDELRGVLTGSSSPGMDRREAAVKEATVTPQDQTNGVVSPSSTHLLPPPASGDPHTGNILDPDQHPATSHSPADCASHHEGPSLSVSALPRNSSTSFETPLSVIPDSQSQRANSSVGNSERGGHTTVDQVQVPRSFYAELSSRSKRCRLDTAAEADNARILSSLPSSNGCATSEKPTETHSQENHPIHLPNGVHKASGHPDHKRQTIPRPDNLVSLSVLPMEIHPPPPPVSTGKFQTHITPTLQMLAERMKLPRKFKPVKQSRDLQPLERGFWFLQMNVFDSDDIARDEANQAAERGKQRDQSPTRQQSEDNLNSRSSGLATHSPNDWSLAFFSQFWSFLTDFISRDGRAGWGVWCILEERHQNQTSEPATSSLDDQQQQPQNRKKTTRPLIMKVYSWGEVAPHIYMLLFLATERRIRGMRAQWRDAGERVVIEMP